MHPLVNVSIRPMARFAVLGALALSASACSQTDRFAYDPFSNPFNGRETTGSVGSGSTMSSAPSGSVSSQPLPPPGGYQPSSYNQSSYTPPPAYAPQQQPPQQAYAPYQQPKPHQPQQAQSAPQTQYKYNSQSGWTAEGGKTVVVQAGDTPFGLGTRHGVPASAILQANNLPPGSALTPGQRLVIPSYNGQKTASKPAAPAIAQAPRQAPAKSGGSHVVKSGETLFSIARTYDVPPRDLASANSFGLDHRVRIGERVNLPGGASAASRPVQTAALQPQPQAQVVKPVFKAEEEKPVKAEPVRAVTKLDDDADTFAPKASSPIATGGTDFRWPVRGRVISGFGSKPNGQTNDGINISVPEGTDIKAAEGGVVAYAGNELKGFGNLILVRHSGDWVTAYAHASEISVKRGDVVRRGQSIGKSGKSGNVSSPQLHFEVRRGASPVDPMEHLPQG